MNNTKFEMNPPGWEALRCDGEDVAEALFTGALATLKLCGQIGKDYTVADAIALTKVMADVYNTSLLKIAIQDVVDSLDSIAANSVEISAASTENLQGLQAIANAISDAVSPHA